MKDVLRSRNWTDYRRAVAITRDLTNNDRVTLGTGTVLLAFIATVVLSSVGINLVVLRQVLGFLLITVVPGVLLLPLVGMDLDDARAVVYAVVASVTMVMLLFTAINILYLEYSGLLLGVQPFTPLTATTITVAFVTTLVIAFRWSGVQPALPSRTTLSLLAEPFALALLLLPFLGSFGALLINYFGWNALNVVAIVLVALVLPYVILKQPSERYYPLAAWSVSATMLLQNSIRLIYLNRGDAKYEYYLANLVMHHEIWSPTFLRNKNAMIRITVLHPVYSFVMDLDLLWEFKLVHPILFSTIAVALYVLFSRQFSARIALWSLFLYVFLHPFYIRLSRDTRSGAALLFIVVCVLVWTETEMKRIATVALSGLSLFGLVTSHYGFAYLFLFMLAGTAVATYVEASVSGDTFRSGVSLTYPPLFLGLLYVWYNYTSGARTFATLTTISVTTLLQISQFFSLQSRSTEVIATNYSSFTMEFIKYEFMLVTLLAGFGYCAAALDRPLIDPDNYSGTLASVVRVVFHNRLLTGYRGVWGDSIPDIDSIYFYLIVGGLSLLFLSFAPVDTFGLERIYMIGSVFVIPFVVVTAIGVPTTVSRGRIGQRPILASLAVVFGAFLLVNAGVVSAVGLHEKNPQPNLDRTGIIEHGDREALFTLYARYTTESDFAGTAWLEQYRTSENVFTSGGLVRHYPSYFFVTEYDAGSVPGINYYSIAATPDAMDNREGYIFIAEYGTRTNTVGVMTRPGKTINTISLSETNADLVRRQKVYDNGWVAVYLAGGHE